MRCRERTDIEGCREQGPYPYARGVSAFCVRKCFGKEVERPFFPFVAEGVSCIGQAILGPSLVGGRLWGMEHEEDNRRNGPRISGTPQGSAQFGEGQLDT